MKEYVKLSLPNYTELKEVQKAFNENAIIVTMDYRYACQNTYIITGIKKDVKDVIHMMSENAKKMEHQIERLTLDNKMLTVELSELKNKSAVNTVKNKVKKWWRLF